MSSTSLVFVVMLVEPFDRHRSTTIFPSLSSTFSPGCSKCPGDLSALAEMTASATMPRSPSRPPSPITDRPRPRPVSRACDRCRRRKAKVCSWTTASGYYLISISATMSAPSATAPTAAATMCAAPLICPWPDADPRPRRRPTLCPRAPIIDLCRPAAGAAAAPPVRLSTRVASTLPRSWAKVRRPPPLLRAMPSWR